MLGLAIIILPSSAKSVGYLGFFIGNLVAGIGIVYMISLIISVGVAINYKGKR